MTVMVVIDGLERTGQTPGLPRLDGLVARGTTGRLMLHGERGIPEEGSGWPAWWGLSETEDPPLGYVTALGAGLNPDPELVWGCLGLGHLMRKQEQLILAPGEWVRPELSEVCELAAALREPLAEAGWGLHHFSDGTAVVNTTLRVPDWRTQPLSRMGGESMREWLPLPGREGIDWIRLLTVGQMVLARHPLNQLRIKEGRLPLNTPWIWGIGRGLGLGTRSDHAARTWGWLATSSMVTAGWARVAGVGQVVLLDAGEESAEDAAGSLLTSLTEVALAGRSGVLHLRGAARPWDGEACREQALARMDRVWIGPLADRLAGGSAPLVIVSGFALDAEGRGSRVPVAWVAGRGRQLRGGRSWWHRHRLGEGRLLSVGNFRREWLL